MWNRNARMTIIIDISDSSLKNFDRNLADNMFNTWMSRYGFDIFERSDQVIVEYKGQRCFVKNRTGNVGMIVGD